MLENVFSFVLSHCQTMVVDSVSKPKGIPNLECAEEQFLYIVWLWQQHYWNSSVVIQHGWSSPRTSHPWGQTSLWLDSLTLLTDSLCFLPICFGLHWCALLCSGEISSVFQLSWGTTVFGGKGKCAPRADESRLIWTWSLIGWYVPLSHQVSKFSKFDWSKRHCPDWSE